MKTLGFAQIRYIDGKWGLDKSDFFFTKMLGGKPTEKAVGT